MRVVIKSMSILFVMLFLFSFKGFNQEVKKSTSSKGTIVVRKSDDTDVVIADTLDYEMETEPDQVFNIVEKMPEFAGGEKELYAFIGRNVRYSDSAKIKGIQGRVYVGFIVETDGSILEAEVLRGIGYDCDESALVAVLNMPNWIPGEQRGKKVPVRYILPIQFKLE